MKVIGLDPGCSESGLVVWDGERVCHSIIAPNEEIIRTLRIWSAMHLVVEMISGMGMTVGQTTFETCVWIGRFIEAFDPSGELIHRVPRGEVKMHLCGNMRAKDKNVRQSLLDRFGGKKAAIGKKAAPGPLYGVTSHKLSALAVCLTWWDKNGKI